MGGPAKAWLTMLNHMGSLHKVRICNPLQSSARQLHKVLCICLEDFIIKHYNAVCSHNGSHFKRAQFTVYENILQAYIVTVTTDYLQALKYIRSFIELCLHYIFFILQFLFILFVSFQDSSFFCSSFSFYFKFHVYNILFNNTINMDIIFQ